MTGRKPRAIIPIDDVYMFTDGHARLSKFRVEAIKLALTGSDLRKVAEFIAPKWAGRSFETKTEDQKEDFIRYVYKDIRDYINDLSDEDRQRIMTS